MTNSGLTKQKEPRWRKRSIFLRVWNDMLEKEAVRKCFLNFDRGDGDIWFRPSPGGNTYIMSPWYSRGFSQKCMCACLCATSQTKLFSHHLHTGFSCFCSAVPLFKVLFYNSHLRLLSLVLNVFSSPLLTFFPLTFASHSSMFSVPSAYWKRGNCRS